VERQVAGAENEVGIGPRLKIETDAALLITIADAAVEDAIANNKAQFQALKCYD
jgi:hypothetical protein